jgi:hypothetical protein
MAQAGAMIDKAMANTSPLDENLPVDLITFGVSGSCSAQSFQ